MSKVEQPLSLPLPEWKEVEGWSRLAAIRHEWLAFVAPQLGLDSKKLLLGHGLSNIVGSDENVFGSLMVYNGSTVKKAKNAILILLDWESRLTEFPENIRVQIREARNNLASLDWMGKRKYFIAWKTWSREVRDFTQREINKHGKLQRALNYELAVTHIWRPYWQEFLYGHTLT